MRKVLKITVLFCLGLLVVLLSACDLVDLGALSGTDDGGTTAVTTTEDGGAHVHSFTEHIVKAPTCTEEGQKDLVCACGYTESCTLLPQHRVIKHDGKKPTCNAAGWMDYETCALCSYSAYTELEPTPDIHPFGADGICSACGASAAEGLTFTLSDDEEYYIVSGSAGCRSNEIHVPSHHEGLEVRAIGMSALSYRHATKIVLPDTVTFIDEGAFAGCSELTEIVLPSGLRSIGASAFTGCALTSLVLPDSVESLGDFIFSRCDKLTEVTLGKGFTTLGRGIFDSCDSMEAVHVHEENSSFLSVDGNLFSKDGTVFCYYAPANSATSFTLPANVTAIGAFAFCGCTTLHSVTLPTALVRIGEYAFAGCSALESITLPEGLESLGDNAFSETGLTSVVIPDSVTTVGSWCFFNSKALRSVTIGTGVTLLGGQVVGCCESLTELIFRDPNGWYVEMNGSFLGERELGTSASAIDFLRDTHCQNRWLKLVE